MARWRGENGGKGTGNRKYNWLVQNRQGEINKSIGKGEAKELTCMTHGHELRGWGRCWWDGGCRAEGGKGEEKNGTTVIA